MNYHPDDFLNLLGEIEQQGGTHLTDPCEPQQFRLKQPDPATGKLLWKDLHTVGCGQPTRFEISLLQGPELHEHSERASEQFGERDEVIDFNSEPQPSGPVTVCAVDDNAGAWPRFRHTLTTGQSR